MRVLSASELLGLFERGQAESLSERAVTLLAAACPETSPEVLATLSIGQRDTCLLTLREWTFGPELVGLASCPGCGEGIELTFAARDIRLASEVSPAEVLSLTVSGYELQFRLPNSLDLAIIHRSKDILAARSLLLERCLLALHHDGEEISSSQLPDSVVDMIAERMEQADPQADVELALSCPLCRHEWRVIFDILSFFWSEISAWALRILREVHALASTYGWREPDILAMSPWRRQAYLQMVRG